MDIGVCKKLKPDQPAFEKTFKENSTGTLGKQYKNCQGKQCGHHKKKKRLFLVPLDNFAGLLGMLDKCFTCMGNRSQNWWLFKGEVALTTKKNKKKTGLTAIGHCVPIFTDNVHIYSE